MKKFCTKCFETKVTSLFGLNKASRDGFYYWCRQCVKVQNDKRKHRQKLRVETRTCTGCKKTKAVVEFGRSSAETTGYKKQCKVCRRSAHHKNRDLINKKQREYRRNNLTSVKAKEDAYREINKEKVLANRVLYRRENRGKRAADQAKRRANKLFATPGWADLQHIKDLYVNCREAERVFGSIGLEVKFEVDHIIPLQGKGVSGLHVESNLQILTAQENAKKHNLILKSLGG